MCSHSETLEFRVGEELVARRYRGGAARERVVKFFVIACARLVPGPVCRGKALGALIVLSASPRDEFMNRLHPRAGRADRGQFATAFGHALCKIGDIVLSERMVGEFSVDLIAQCTHFVQPGKLLLGQGLRSTCGGWVR
jgi:hypothetical protein